MGQERWKAIHAMTTDDIAIKIFDAATSRAERKLLRAEWHRRQDKQFMHVNHALENRRSGKVMPFGATDDRGRWVATPFEECSDCKNHVSTLSDPMRQYRHCCGVEHVARFCMVDVAAFKRFLKRYKGK